MCAIRVDISIMAWHRRQSSKYSIRPVFGRQTLKSICILRQWEYSNRCDADPLNETSPVLWHHCHMEKGDFRNQSSLGWERLSFWTRKHVVWNPLLWITWAWTKTLAVDWVHCRSAGQIMREQISWFRVVTLIRPDMPLAQCEVTGNRSVPCAAYFDYHFYNIKF